MTIYDHEESLAKLLGCETRMTRSGGRGDLSFAIYEIDVGALPPHQQRFVEAVRAVRKVIGGAYGGRLPRDLTEFLLREVLPPFREAEFRDGLP